MIVTELLGFLASAGLAIGGGLRWALRLWATVRREQMEADKAAAALAIAAHDRVAAQASLDHQRMVEALVTQARSMAELGGKIETLGAKLETIADWRERTPVEGVRRVEPEDFDADLPPPRKLRTNPHGYRPPRPGGG